MLAGAAGVFTALADRPTAANPVLSSAGTPALGGADVLPDEEPGPRTLHVLSARSGPGDGYHVIATFARGLRLEVIGRDVSYRWLAVQVGGAGLIGWVEASGVADVESAGVLAILGPTATPEPAGSEPAGAPTRAATARPAATPVPTARPPSGGAPGAPPPATAPLSPVDPRCAELARRGYQNSRERDFYLRYCR